MGFTTPYSEGDPESKLLVLAESPSFNEVRERRPLCGPAGHLFDRTLHAAQIARASCYILNVFEDQVIKKDSDASKIFSQSGALLWTSTKGITEAGREAARGTLERIGASSANCIVCLGGPALHLVTGDNRSVAKWRGSIIEGAAVKRKVVGTLHPSHALRGAYESRYLIVADLKRAKSESASPTITPPRRNIVIDPSFDACLKYLHRAQEANAFDTDIEVLNGQVDCFSIALSPSEAISIPIVDAHFEHRWSPEEELQIWLAYAKLLASPRILKVNQNIVFDLATLLQLNHLVPAGPVADPMVAFSIMNPFLSKSLATICSLYTREPYYKDDGELHDTHNIEDFERRWLYNAKDAAVAMEAWLAMEPELDRDGYRTTYDMTMEMASSLIYMMVSGIKVNSEALKQTRVDVVRRREATIKRLEDALGRPVITEAPKKAAEKRAAVEARALNINSPAQMCGYFYDEKKLGAYTSKSGGRSVDDLALARIIRRDGLQEARLLQEYRRLNTLLTRYLDIGYDRDNRLRSSFNIRGTWTGRLSSSQTIFLTGGNLQNIPPDVRGFLIADDPCQPELQTSASIS